MPESTYQVILARQERQKEFLQGLKDAGHQRNKALAEAALWGVGTFAAVRAYQRYHAAKRP